MSCNLSGDTELIDSGGDIATILHTITHDDNFINTDHVGNHLDINYCLIGDSNLLWVHTQIIKYQYVATRSSNLVTAVYVGDGVGLFAFHDNGYTYEWILGIVDDGT